MKPKEKQRSFHVEKTLLEKTSDFDCIDENSGYISKRNTTSKLPEFLKRNELKHFPSLSEFEVLRHFTNLSKFNFSIDEGFYPLGSCTMKYNPRINDKVSNLSGFANLHPLMPKRFTQGALKLMHDLQEALMNITGLKACSLSPAAGAQGELVGVKMIAAYHKKNQNLQRNTMLVPDSAHGTNPASAALCGFKVKQIPTSKSGVVEVKDVKKLLDDTVAGIMMTVPNTLGIFEKNIVEISKCVHENGSLVYCDGANLNALVGQVDFGKMGVDVMHINLHKTFSTPHGGGGPGAGPVVVSDYLKDFLPTPIVSKMEGLYIKFGFKAIPYEAMPRYFQRISNIFRIADVIRHSGEELLVMKME